MPFQAAQKVAKFATKIVWGAAKSIMTMSVDRGLLEAGFNAAEMGAEKLRQLHAKKYANIFAAISSFEASLQFADLGGKTKVEIAQMCEETEQKIGELWTHLVVGDGRWETCASFGIMITKVILKVTSTTDKAEDLALWCLKGDGSEGEVAYEGLLSLMAHGDPKTAKDRKVESLSLSLSIW